MTYSTADMVKKKLRVLVIYGGEAATVARNELLAWLGRESLGVQAEIVANEVAHSEGTVDDRVDAAIARADKAIAILTPDSRLKYAAPNVMDEIGRWRGAKSKSTMCIVRQEGVEPYSNHNGVVYLEFKERIREAFDGIHDFLLVPTKATKPSAAKNVAKTPKSKAFVVESNPDVVLIDGRRYATSKIEQAQNRITLTLAKLDGEGEAALHDVENRRRSVHIVFGNTSHTVIVESVKVTHERTVAATLVMRTQDRQFSAMLDMSIGNLSADQIATLRAERILFNDPPKRAANVADLTESFIRGGSRGATAVTESPIPALLEQLPRDQRATWETLRLLLILELQLSGTVEHVEKLKLNVGNGRLLRIEFRGRRYKQYVNHDAFVIELDRAIDM